MQQFQAVLSAVNNLPLVRLPKEESAKLPSRGMVMVKGTLNEAPFTLPLEPDGKGGHWLEMPESVLKAAGARVGDRVALAFDVTDAWPEPDMPQDIMQGIEATGLLSAWLSLTVKARWSWLRWIRATLNADTRQKRIRVAVDKLSRGDRRPCCFNAAGCTVPTVSKGGILRDGDAAV